ncbi:MAG: class I SAM-dependent methyltransferase [Bdellovibrionaceae bacterium]|nr:class I SAM-dependent methyltransferase [Bdellovibrionales bacterium]MCB9083952.1 class I SAM-dependent methyltransferase [Pseudobdellovibrionaceae bacterium]
MSLLNPLKKCLTYLVLSGANKWTSPYNLERRPEPEVSDEAEQVAHYDRVMETSMAVVYGVSLELICRILRTPKSGQRIVDLCCGPGQFTRLLGKSFPDCEVHGLDLSPPMLECLRKNLPAAFAHCENMIEAPSLVREGFELITAMNCLHHLPDQKDVGKALKTMEDLSSAEGVIFVTDPLRLKNQWQTNLYTDTYGMKGRPDFSLFHRDFELSMAAAWTADELVSCLPSPAKKSWHLMIPFGVPVMGILVGIPRERGQHLFVDEIQSPLKVHSLIPKEFRTDFQMLKRALKLGTTRKIT